MSAYVDYHPLLTRGAIWNFLTGHRSAGKTYGFKDWGIRDWKKHGNEMIYLRRYESELEDRYTFFDDIAEKYENYDFRTKGYTMQAKKVGKNTSWQRMGHFRWLSTQQARKGGDYSKCNKIMFDEFIIENTRNMHYLTNEVNQALGFWHTVDRRRFSTRMIFASNAVSIVNPYFVKLGISIDDLKNKEFIMRANNRVCVHLYHNAESENELMNSAFGDLAKATGYDDYAIANKFMDDTDTFVSSIPKDARYCYAIQYGEQTFSVYLDSKMLQYYVGDYARQTNNVFCLTKNDMTPNLLMIQKSHPIIKALLNMYRLGNVYFSSAKCRELFYEMSNVLNLQ